MYCEVAVEHPSVGKSAKRIVSRLYNKCVTSVLNRRTYSFENAGRHYQSGMYRFFSYPVFLGERSVPSLDFSLKVVNNNVKGMV